MVALSTLEYIHREYLEQIYETKLSWLLSSVKLQKVLSEKKNVHIWWNIIHFHL